MKYTHERTLPDYLKVQDHKEELDLLNHMDNVAALEIGRMLIQSGEIVRTKNVTRERITWTLNTYGQYARLAARHISGQILAPGERDMLEDMTRNILASMGT